MVVFSSAAAAARASNMEEEEEEPGEVIESAPPMKVGEERQINDMGLRKKLLKKGLGWESPVLGDEVTVHYIGFLLDGSKFVSSRDKQQPLTFKLGHGELVAGLDHGIITMIKGEKALFTLPSDLGYGANGADGVPPHSEIQYEVELISWLTVVDVCKDGGIMKKILLKGKRDEQPGDLDQVTVKFEARLLDGSIAAKTPDEGVEFYLKDGYFCTALSKVLKTMRREEKVLLTVQPQYAFGEHGYAATSEFSAVPPNSALVVGLELVSFKPVIDVTGDLIVLKKILREGEGIRCPDDGSLVSVICIGMLEDGTIFERKGLDEADPFEFVIGEEQVISGLDRAVATMKKGEISVVTIKPEFGFGNVEVRQGLAAIPASSTLMYEVEMLGFTMEKELFEMTYQERIETAEKKKQEGNKLFKSGKYQRAAKRYDKAAEYVSEEKGYGDQEKLAKSIRISCWLNNAACSLKLNNFQGAVKLCSRVLDIESNNVKALYRRAEAYMKTSDLDLAELDVEKALAVDPQNREVKSMQKTLKQLQVESNKRYAKLYSNMFSSTDKDADVKVKRLKLDTDEGKKVGSKETMDVD